MTKLESLKKARSAIAETIATLDELIRDDLNGLSLCGCGGIPVLQTWKTENGKQLWRVICTDCEIRTADCTYELAAENDWNGAMRREKA